MPDLNDFHAFESTSGEGEDGGSGKFGCSLPMIFVFVLSLVFISVFGRC